MSEKSEKLKKFIEAVNGEVEARVAEILTEAENEKKRIISAAEKKGSDEAERYLEDKKRNTGRDLLREVSAAELEVKRSVLLHREKLTDTLFEDVKKRIADYRKTPDYIKKLEKMLADAKIDTAAEIMLAPEDMGLADRLAKQLSADNAVFKADANIRLGGLAVFFKEKGIVIDKTFDLALEEQRSEFTASNAFAQE